MMKHSIGFLLAWGLLLLPAARSVPVDFIDEGIAEIASPMDIVFLPAPGANLPQPMLVPTKEGELWIIDDPDNDSEPRLLGDIGADGRICTNGSRGFMSVIPHPNFNANRWLYFFYVNKGPDPADPCALDPLTGPHNVVSRFRLNADYTINMSTEDILLEMSPMPRTLHVGGDMAFGVDGNLWITVGDGGFFDPPVSQYPHYLLGSLLRITPAGGIPVDNPYQGPNTARCHQGGIIAEGLSCQEAYAMGFRSPYRFARDVNAVDGNGTPFDRFFVSDVGSNIFEEINEVGTHRPAANYGWPYIEGPCDRREGGNALDCSPDGYTSNFQDPYHWYQRNVGEDAAAVGGAFIPNGLWPPQYDGSFLYADYPRGETYHLVDAAGCRDCASPTPPTSNSTWNVAENVNAMSFGPYQQTQALYYCQRGIQNILNIRRVRYIDIVDPAPICDLDVTYNGGLSVTFDASGTVDPGGQTLEYEWNFGTGSPPITSTVDTQTFSYPSTGQYNFLLKVTDDSGNFCTSLFDVVLGLPPTVNIISPAEGTLFAVGDTFVLQAEAFDSNGVQLSDSSLSWEMRRHHNLHYHPWLAPTAGNNLQTPPSPPPEDLGSVETSYMEILVTATDSNGLTTTVSRNVDPKLVEVDFLSVPCDATTFVRVEDLLLTTPARVILWENQLANIDASDVDGHGFLTWSDGGAQEHYIRVPAEGSIIPAYVAVFGATNGNTLSPTPAPSFGGAPTSDLFYGVSGVETVASTLHSFDLQTEVAVEIGAVLYNGSPLFLHAIAFDPTAGVLYASTSASSPGFPLTLFRIDPFTAQATLIGAFDPARNMIALTFDSGGQLYGWSDTGRDRLVTIDKTTGDVTNAGTATYGTGRAGLAFDDDGMLYLLERERLYTVNPASGVATLQKQYLEFPFRGQDGDIEPGTKLFYQTERIRNGSVVKYDLDSLAHSVIETGIDDLCLLAFASS